MDAGFKDRANAWLAERALKKKAKVASSSQAQPKPKVAPKNRAATTKKGAKVKKESPSAEDEASASNSQSRSAVFRKAPSQKVLQKMERAMTQRMMLISRERGNESSSQVTLQKTFKIMGSTGNCYTVVVGSHPHCDCPDYRKNPNDVCKHVVFVFLKVLKLPVTDHYWYQKELLPWELMDIFMKAKPDPTTINSQLQSAYLVATGQQAPADPDPDPDPSTKSSSGRRNIPQPGEDSCCPICYEDFTPGVTNGLLFCETSCGNPVHEVCFEQWQRNCSSSAATCVWCRSILSKPEEKKSICPSQGNEYGMAYVNLASASGMDSSRDFSTYSHPSLLGLYRNGTITKEEYAVYSRGR